MTETEEMIHQRFKKALEEHGRRLDDPDYRRRLEISALQTSVAVSVSIQAQRQAAAMEHRSGRRY
ncbi:MAG: hypothetical protein A2571_03290 [Candidatus Vogelbacteria bacterium RIFOXYD1_FULL_44_32]|uniref:Uncharacterized protein n=1 Tax=Candidatus Vogelbacteria bacterium RIFOXYD1_FULL_44_32 TaxID=1802438 RepID=A0A1G2QCF0_9BACT|nr:MAG: hypothetical protein A2571_03290 [Candidatus Vogelbacteria bacterium RIFOXYD1_FULL_44_32]